jgi:hypothetical protein
MKDEEEFYPSFDFLIEVYLLFLLENKLFSSLKNER